MVLSGGMFQAMDKKTSASSYFEQFLQYIIVEKNYSPHTLTNYRIDLSEFGSFLDSLQVNSIAKVDYFILRINITLVVL